MTAFDVLTTHILQVLTLLTREIIYESDGMKVKIEKR